MQTHKEKNESGSGKQALEQGQRFWTTGGLPERKKLVECGQDLRLNRRTQCASAGKSHGVCVIKDNRMQKVRGLEKKVLGEKRWS